VVQRKAVLKRSGLFSLRQHLNPVLQYLNHASVYIKKKRFVFGDEFDFSFG